MLEIRLLSLLIICVATLVIGGIIAVRSYKNCGKCCIVIPVTADSENIELVLRETALKFVRAYPETEVLLINFSADPEKILICERLLGNSCKYSVINSEKTSENICNIMQSVVY